jgi:hypothetical protein
MRRVHASGNPVLHKRLGNGKEQKGSKGKPRMTCRIDRLVGGDHLVILRISGRITGDDVNILRASLEQESCAAAIDLKDVILVDREVVKLLALCESNGNELRNCPLYIREWITRERKARKA